MTGIVVLGGVFVGYALIASRLDRWNISGPMVFVAAGAILGPAVLGVIPAARDGEFTKTLAELTLAVLLFADASTIRLRQAEGDVRLPLRLLFIGLPLTILVGAVAAHALFPSGGWAMAALIAAILAPTDAALGLAVVTNPSVPTRIRQALNIEAGLNDGICTPFVFLFAAFVAEASRTERFARDALGEMGIAVLVAIAIGWGVGSLARIARNARWTSPASEDLIVLTTALVAYGSSVAVGGNGFVASFLGGIIFGSVSGHRFHAATEFTETVALFASFAVWTLFGINFVGPVVVYPIGLAPIEYALLSLTLVRMIPVALSLVGSGLRRDTVMFMGWFGPRGLASAVFTLLSVDLLRESGVATAPIVHAATWTILLSVMLHGLTSGPLARIYGRRTDKAPERYRAEVQEAQEPRLRRRAVSG